MLRRLAWFGPRRLEVISGSADMLQAFRKSAGHPRATVEERADAVVLSLDAPGARRANTDIVWDEEQRRLVVGVWAGKRPGSRGVARPELAWYRSHRLPRCVGRAARATVDRRGRVQITVPRLLARDRT